MLKLLGLKRSAWPVGDMTLYKVCQREQAVKKSCSKLRDSCQVIDPNSFVSYWETFTQMAKLALDTKRNFDISLRADLLSQSGTGFMKCHLDCTVAVDSSGIVVGPRLACFSARDDEDYLSTVCHLR